jgi:hypothetical protein
MDAARSGTPFITNDLASPFSRLLGHPDFEAFVRAAAVAPRDRARLLVLSDWLQDQDDDAAAEAAHGPDFGEMLEVAQFERATGAHGTKSCPHGPEPEMLRRIGAAMAEVARLPAERDLLKKAAAYFASPPS